MALDYLDVDRSAYRANQLLRSADPTGHIDMAPSWNAAKSVIVAAYGGGRLELPPGSYITNSTLVADNDNILFDGYGWGTQISPGPLFPTGQPLFKVAAPGGAGNFRYGCGVRDIFFNGNNQAGVGAIELDSTYGARIVNVRIRYCPGTGIYLTDPSSGGARGAYTEIDKCFITDGGAGIGILSAFSENWSVHGGLLAFYNSAGGVGIKNQDGGCTIGGVQFDECDTSYWQFFAGATVFQGNNLGRAVSRHVYLNGTKGCTILGNYFDMCVGTPNPAAIIFADNSQNDRNFIGGNTVIGTGQGWTYGYYEAGGIGGANILGPNHWAGLAVQSFGGLAGQNSVSVNTPDPGNNGTIGTNGAASGGAATVTRVTPTANETGLILQAGLFNGQQCIIENQGNFTLTFAASGTSHVAGGTSRVVPALGNLFLTWDSASSLWY